MAELQPDDGDGSVDVGDVELDESRLAAAAVAAAAEGTGFTPLEVEPSGDMLLRHHHSDKPQLTFRAVAAGLAVGTLLCFSNMYFGLETGWVTMGSLQSSVLGYGIFYSLRSCAAFQHFTPLENVVLQTTAVATATMPLAGGLIGIVPALGMLSPAESGVDPVVLSVGSLIAWTFSVAFFGVFFAVPLRRQTILREKLRFPSGTATAQMIAMLHHTETYDDEPATKAAVAPGAEERVALTLRRAQAQPHPVSLQPAGHGAGSGAGGSGTSTVQEREWSTKWKVFKWTFFASALLTLGSHFFPVLRSVPIFSAVGLDVLTQWSWTITPSLSYVGQGMIMGPRTAISMLVGALLGWAILGPVAREQAWAPGPISSYHNGARGWVLWLSLAIMMADSMTSLALLLASCLRRHKRSSSSHRRDGSAERFVSGASDGGDDEGDDNDGATHEDDDETGIPAVVVANDVDDNDDDDEAMPVDGGFTVRRRVTSSRSRRVAANDDDVYDPAPPHEQVPTAWWLGGLALSSVLCVVVTAPMFSMPWYEPAVAVVVALLVALLAVRALGETDLNPVSGVGKLSQLVFGVVAPGNVVSNLIAGAIAEAGAMQAGDMMQDLKTGHLLRASPRAQFVAQLIGAAASVLVSVLAYVLFTSAYEVPGPVLQVPTAQIWIDMANIVNGHGVASHVAIFCVVGAILTMLMVILHTKSKSGLIPSGIALAVGMYVTPNWTIARVVGSVLQWAWQRKSRGSHDRLMIVVASGFVLGEGVLAIVNALLKSASVPALSCIGCAPSSCSGCS